MADIVFISPVFLKYILPFALVFTLVFAILQKTEVLGKGKKQVDAIIALIVGLILISFPFARDIIVKLMPFLAVAVVLLLIFMMFYSFAHGQNELHKWVKIVVIVLFTVGLVAMLLYITVGLDKIYEWTFGGKHGGTIAVNILIILVLAGAVIAVLKGAGGSTSKEKKE
ncbi:hypothetical protein GOV14_00865 [Candidatus Pacearchaeota archaeon]|nr:hypothetical protein [Candidatus Pacearchaeota archaeon]